MNATLDPTLLPALDSIYGLLERPARVRHYANDPRVNVVENAQADYHELCFREQLRRDPELARTCQRPVVQERDAEEFFFDQQCPSDSTFR